MGLERTDLGVQGWEVVLVLLLLFWEAAENQDKEKTPRCPKLNSSRLECRRKGRERLIS